MPGPPATEAAGVAMRAACATGSARPASWRATSGSGVLLRESVRTTSTRLTNVWQQMTLEHWQYSSRVMRDTGRLVRIVATLPQWGQLILGGAATRRKSEGCRGVSERP